MNLHVGIVIVMRLVCFSCFLGDIVQFGQSTVVRFNNPLQPHTERDEVCVLSVLNLRPSLNGIELTCGL